MARPAWLAADRFVSDDAACGACRVACFGGLFGGLFGGFVACVNFLDFSAGAVCVFWKNRHTAVPSMAPAGGGR
jgi:hypothetical protein